ncbi:hypothetical protein C8Q75DRAFT_786651 [Abortiporus biennis]|nr:hypothetical protein C8Q75DRAFT_786651 [Abortiporus biennis]
MSYIEAVPAHHAHHHVITEFDHELIKFLSEHYDNGVIHAKGYDQPPKTPDVAAYAAAGGNLIDVGWGPIRIVGKIQGMGITAEIGVNVPILGYKKLAHIAGDLVKGVETAFNLFGVASGSARVFLQGKDVMCELKASILSKNYNNTFKIFSLP